MDIEDLLRELDEKRAALHAGGGAARVQAQHDKGKLTARERIDVLLDADSFVEVNAFMHHRSDAPSLAGREIPGDGVVTGHGTVAGRPVYVFAQDFTVLGGSLGAVHARKIVHIMDQALKVGCPVIGLNDSGGARIQEGVDALKGYGAIFSRNVAASGVIPQISAIMGPCAGGAVYSPALGDFIVMTEGTSHMFITGPQVVKTVLDEDVDQATLGGAAAHSARSGVAHLVGADDETTIGLIRTLLGYLPANSRENPPLADTRDDVSRETPELLTLIPTKPAKPYAVADVVRTVLDDAEFLEIQPDYAQNMVTGFGRLAGRSVGVVANNPAQLAGVLDINSSDKAARFVRFCDAFNIPVVTLVDTPGYMPGREQEHDGIIRHGAKLLFAYAEATVPLLTVILRKAYGGAYIAMGSKSLGADVALALPTAEIAVMGPKGACEVIFKQEIAAATDPQKEAATLTEEYRERFASPYAAASGGHVDDVIDPRSLRVRLISALAASANKTATTPKRKHGIMPV